MIATVTIIYRMNACMHNDDPVGKHSTDAVIVRSGFGSQSP